MGSRQVHTRQLPRALANRSHRMRQPHTRSPSFALEEEAWLEIRLPSDPTNSYVVGSFFGMK